MLPRFLAALALSVIPASLAAQTTVGASGATYTTISAAIQNAKDGDTITVIDSNTYVEALSITGKRLTLTVAAGATPTLTPSITGFDQGPVISITGNSASGTVINGFKITGAGKQLLANAPQGAVYVYGSSPVLSNNTLTGNYCAGIYVTNGSPTLIGNKITATTVGNCGSFEGLGSGIVVAGNDTNSIYQTTISSNTIYGNTASVLYATDKGGGAAINVTNSATPVTITDNTLRNNTSTGYGGAVYVAGTPNLYFLNNLVYGNKGISGGLDIVVPGSTVGPVAGVLANNTIGYNTATTNSAGSDIYIGGNLAQYQFVNNIVVGTVNGQTALNCGVTYAGQTITPLVLDHNDFVALAGTTSIPVGGACTNPGSANGNLALPPQFTNVSSATVSAGTANFQLLASSPLIDMGNNSVIPVSTTDLPGNNRFVDILVPGVPVIDMGAYELQPPVKCPTCLGPTVSVLALTPSSYTPTVGSPFTLTATFQSIGQTGSVTFYEDGASIGTGPINNATATFTLPTLTIGLHTFYASYDGDTKFTPATSIYINILVKSPTLKNTVTTLTANPSTNITVGATVILTASVSTAASTGTPVPGTVYFIDGSNQLGSAVVNQTTGTASVNATFTAGTHSLTAAFVPDDTLSYNGSTGSLTLVVTGASVNAVLTTDPIADAFYGQTITVTATMTPTTSNAFVPQGNVTFYIDGGISASPAPVTNGVASFQANSLPLGTHTFTCTYNGDANFSPATCNTTSITIANGIPTQSTLAITPTSGATAGDPMTLTATVGPLHPSTGYPTPKGSVTFTDNGTSLGTVTIASGTGSTGTAAFSIASLTGGNHTYACTYSGDTTYAGSTCNSVSTAVALATPTLTLSASSNPTFAVAPFTLTALLVNQKGNPIANAPIALTQSGSNSTLTATTNSSGVATFTVAASVPSVTFQANLSATGTYSAATANLTVAINPNQTTGTLIAAPTTSYEGQTVSVVVSISNNSSNVTAAGYITLYDGANKNSTLNLPASTVGTSLTSVTFPVNTLAAGTHTLTAIYTPTPDFIASTFPGTTITINPSTFTLTADPSITIQSGHHSSTTLTVTSIGAFAGNITLGLTGSIPPVLTATFGHNPVVLPVNGSVSTAMNLETDAIPNFYALLPFALLPLALRKRHRKLALIAIFALVAILPLSGCSGHYPAQTPPGTYDLAVQATGSSPNGSAVTQVVHIKLIVTP